MAQRRSRNKKPIKPVFPSGENYGYKPFKIGPLLKEKAKAKGFDKKYIAAYLGISWRNIYKIYEQAILSFPKLMKWSEMLDENLLLLYHPNVKPLPDPCEQLRKELETERKEFIRIEDSKNRLLTENIKIKGQNELLKEQVREFMKGKG